MDLHCKILTFAWLAKSENTMIVQMKTHTKTVLKAAPGFKMHPNNHFYSFAENVEHSSLSFP